MQTQSLSRRQNRQRIVPVLKLERLGKMNIKQKVSIQISLYKALFIMVLTLLICMKSTEGQTFTAFLTDSNDCNIDLSTLSSTPCNGMLGYAYHCLPDDDGKFGIGCVLKSWIPKGYCPFYRRSNKAIDIRSCKGNASLCPATTYLSPEAFKYPNCIQNPKKSSTPKPTTEKATTTTTAATTTATTTTITTTTTSYTPSTVQFEIEHTEEIPRSNCASTLRVILIGLLPFTALLIVNLAILFKLRERRKDTRGTDKDLNTSTRVQERLIDPETGKFPILHCVPGKINLGYGYHE